MKVFIGSSSEARQEMCNKNEILPELLENKENLKVDPWVKVLMQTLEKADARR